MNEEKENVNMTLQTCDAIGCYEECAVNREASRHYGSSLMPAVIYLNSEPYYFCPRHLVFYRNWAESKKEVTYDAVRTAH